MDGNLSLNNEQTPDNRRERMNPSKANRDRILALFAAGLQLAGLFGLSIVLDREPRSVLEQIVKGGVLVVAVRDTPSAYFDGANGPDGFEYTLARRFADALNVEVRYIIPENIEDILDATSRAAVHLAAASLSHTTERELLVDFSVPYRYVTEQVVYRRGSRRPRGLDEIEPGDLYVVSGSSHDETLLSLRQDGTAALSWRTEDDSSIEDLLAAVDRGKIRLTMANSIDLALYRRIYARAAKAFEIGDPKPIAWAFPKSADRSLPEAADRFLQSLEENGELDRLRARYFGHTGRLNFVDVREFWRNVRDRLPTLRPFFELAGKETGIDWRLLAAIGYQESHWQADAVSPTGVRGIMMLTQNTAEQMGVTDRSDPKQSILGGAQYLLVVERKIPERIAEPNRLWLTLAGYNVGFGHLEDARVLTQRDGGNPDLWLDVKQRLPLLSKKEFYKTVRHGFARGREPVDYVENIRNYFELLVWFTTAGNEKTQQRLAANTAPLSVN